MNRTLALLVVTLEFSSCGDSGPAGPVAAPVASVTLSPTALALTAGTSERLIATTLRQDGVVLTGRTVTWASNDSTVASVSTTGLVTALRAGTATITATSEQKSGNAAVTVSPVLLGRFVAVAAGSAHTCALRANGAAFCWGRGESGQLGVAVPITPCTTDAGIAPCSMTPLAVAGGLTFTKLATGVLHTCGLTGDGTAYCWGSNSTGQLGNDSLGPRTAPVPVNTTLKFVSIDAGAMHTCALTLLGKAYCWGNNFRGQLGDTLATDRSVFIPVAVIGGHTFKSVHAGGASFGHTCALTIDGAAYCWGDNDRGQLGTGSPSVGVQAVPVRVAGGLTFASLTVGLGKHSCGITTGGDAYCWGDNTFGGLGDGTTEHRSAPVAVTGGIKFSQLAAGGFVGGHTCGHSTSGVAYCWGEGVAGQLGNASRASMSQPVAVAGGHTYASIDSGYRHTCGRTPSGVYCWGSNGAGQLGDNSNLGKDIPAKVEGQE